MASVQLALASAFQNGWCWVVCSVVTLPVSSSRTLRSVRSLSRLRCRHHDRSASVVPVSGSVAATLSPTLTSLIAPGAAVGHLDPRARVEAVCSSGPAGIARHVHHAAPGRRAARWPPPARPRADVGRSARAALPAAPAAERSPRLRRAAAHPGAELAAPPMENRPPVSRADGPADQGVPEQVHAGVLPFMATGDQRAGRRPGRRRPPRRDVQPISSAAADPTTAPTHEAGDLGLVLLDPLRGLLVGVLDPLLGRPSSPGAWPPVVSCLPACRVVRLLHPSFWPASYFFATHFGPAWIFFLTYSWPVVLLLHVLLGRLVLLLDVLLRPSDLLRHVALARLVLLRRDTARPSCTRRST